MDIRQNLPYQPLSSCETELKKSKSISKRDLVNKLNFLNFTDRTILVNFKHTKYATTISLDAKPLPSAGESLECLWMEPPASGVLRAYTFLNLFISDGHTCLLVKPENVTVDERGVRMVLPEASHEIRSRKMNRQSCHDIQVQVTQNSAIFNGLLVDISPVSLCTQVTSSSQQSFQWLNHSAPVNLRLHSGENLLYSGECTIIRKECDQSTGLFVLSPVNTCFQRFKPKKFRSSRHRLSPSPNMVCIHPLTGKRVNLKILDLSGSGFSVEESARDSILFAGLLIPELELHFAHNCRMKCQAQVVYRTSNNNVEEDVVTCGLTILNMDMKDHVSLQSLLQQTGNKDSYIDAAVDMDALWNFFFATGFIYPSKYAFFQSNKREIKRTYEKLYTNNPSIARHFIYQKNGAILGHMAMVRFHENSWLIHHHAASKSDSMKAGIVVLKQISGYLNDLYRLRSAHLDFVYYYFRPENKFPHKVFGGFASHINDLNGCSLDDFAYFYYHKNTQDCTSLAAPWRLTETRPIDQKELNNFYKFVSGGLMMEAFNLFSTTNGIDELTKEYSRLGFKKEKHCYSLLEANELKAIIIADISDIGLNMANLTNCTTVIVLDDTTPRSIVESALANIVSEYESNEMPVLMYPVAYAQNTALPIEKIYSLCIMNLQYTDLFLKYCDDLFHAYKKRSDLETRGAYSV